MRAKHLFVAALAGGVPLLAVACEDHVVFTAGLEKQICEDSIPAACGAMGRCVLDTEHYLEGRFPGGQRFLIHTTGEADLRFIVNLTDRMAPGSSLTLVVYEPSCVEKSSYDTGGRDIFQDTGPEGLLTIPIHVRRPGDHLVEIHADAYCTWQLKYE